MRSSSRYYAPAQGVGRRNMKRLRKLRLKRKQTLRPGEWLSITDARYAALISQPQEYRLITLTQSYQQMDSQHGTTTSLICSVKKKIYKFFAWLAIK